MFSKEGQPVAWGAWTTPIGRSLRACSPRARRRRRVVDAGLVLLSLMQDLQLHRGLSCAVLDGQHAFADELDAVGAKLQRSLHACSEHPDQRHALFAEQPWQALAARWESLRTHWRELEFATNLTVHSELVLGLVDLLAGLAERHASLLSPRSVRALGEWPPMVEHLGMLRAIGLHRLAHPESAGDATFIAVFALHLHEVRSTLAAVDDMLGGQAVHAAGHRVVELAIALRGAPPEWLDATAYYAETTAVIDAWYALIRARLFDEA